MDEDYIFLGTWEIEGGRVAALMCIHCGVTIFLHPEVNVLDIHRDRHEEVLARGVPR